MAFRANQISGASSCREAYCCETDVPLTKDDIGIIVNGIRSGEISSGVIKDAIARSEDPEQNGICPFLTPERRCSIYDHRPLVCVVWGIGGDPLDEKDYDLAVERYKQGKSDTYPNMLLIQANCIPCRIETHPDSTPIEANELALKARKALRYKRKGGEEYAMTDFLREELPLIR